MERKLYLLNKLNGKLNFQRRILIDLYSSGAIFSVHQPRFYLGFAGWCFWCHWCSLYLPLGHTADPGHAWTGVLLSCFQEHYLHTIINSWATNPYFHRVICFLEASCFLVFFPVHLQQDHFHWGTQLYRASCFILGHFMSSISYWKRTEKGEFVYI